ncbi:Polyisoprenoid-binding protein YceI [Singulisphaera sp. GP187]|uniref:YceI family protein n=1 Tax=Singulisphaera sp. GP187 TaxID=1882752 RepID=UPI00092BE661|nr:YceI family protein [Singulisphaera sp. GP187]SIN73304.1 Polyisoprenoid-binding protein YceI [Singulisphaera sp. GP187]
MTVRKLTLMAGLVSGMGLSLGHANPAAAQAYKVDTVHSATVFRVKHMNTSYSYGRFNDISGQFSLDEKDPKNAHLDIVVKTDSIDTANANRDKHLKSPDFFNAVQYKTISFKSKSVAKSGADTFQVHGDLTLHGVTKPLALTVTRTGAGKDMKGKPVAGFETEFAIKRSDFNMNKMLEGIGDDVKIVVSVEGGQ